MRYTCSSNVTVYKLHVIKILLINQHLIILQSLEPLYANLLSGDTQIQVGGSWWPRSTLWLAAGGAVYWRKLKQNVTCMHPLVTIHSRSLNAYNIEHAILYIHVAPC